MKPSSTYRLSFLLLGIISFLSPSLAAHRPSSTTNTVQTLPLRTLELPNTETQNHAILSSSSAATALQIRGGSWLMPAGWNPMGYRITPLGEEFLSYEGSLESDVGRFLASLKHTRKRFATLKEQWLEVLRVSKTGQSMRVYKQLHELLQFCLRAGLLD